MQLCVIAHNYIQKMQENTENAVCYLKGKFSLDSVCYCLEMLFPVH